MKQLIAFCLLMVAIVAVAADKSTAVFTLDHQMHQGCKVKITTNLRYEKGVQKIDVSLSDNTITIVYNSDKTDPAKIVAAFKKIGFNAVMLSLNGKEVEPQPAEK